MEDSKIKEYQYQLPLVFAPEDMKCLITPEPHDYNETIKNDTYEDWRHNHGN
jgi:hypothetical protein